MFLFLTTLQNSEQGYAILIWSNGLIVSHTSFSKPLYAPIPKAEQEFLKESNIANRPWIFDFQARTINE